MKFGEFFDALVGARAMDMGIKRTEENVKARRNRK